MFAPPTLTGIITAVASLITAISLLVTAFGVVVPKFREIRMTQKEQDRKLDTIHVLVNSTLTAAKDAQRAGAERELILLREMRDVHLDSGREPSERDNAHIAEAEQRVRDLRAELEDRARQGAKADALEHRREV
jgi:hypothetical protein